MDFVKLVVIVLLVILAVATAAVVVSNSVAGGGPTWFTRLSTPQQSPGGSEVDGSPMTVLTELIWIPFGWMGSYESAALEPDVGLIAGLAMALVAVLIAVLVLRWAVRVLGS